MVEISEEMKGELVAYQGLQQQFQLISAQRQQLQMQAAELDRAADEVSKAAGETGFYRAVGGVLVPKGKADLQKDLKEEKESLEVRAGVMEKQEQKIRERLDAIRKKFESFEKGAAGKEKE
jgi:prefoldin beta subunit